MKELQTALGRLNNTLQVSQEKHRQQMQAVAQREDFIKSLELEIARHKEEEQKLLKASLYPFDILSIVSSGFRSFALFVSNGVLSTFARLTSVMLYIP